MLSLRVSEPTTDEGPERNARGLFAIGPQLVTASDVLAKLIGYGHCPVAASDPREERRQKRLYSGREAQRQRELAR